MGLGRLPGACTAHLQPDTSLLPVLASDRDETIESVNREPASHKDRPAWQFWSDLGHFYAFFFVVNDSDRRRRVEE